MFGNLNNMPLCKVESVEVIGNVVEEHERIRRERITYIKERPYSVNGQMTCPKCNEPMESPLGIYNGISDGDDEGRNYRTYSYECKNFHYSGWTDLV